MSEIEQLTAVHDLLEEVRRSAPASLDNCKAAQKQSLIHSFRRRALGAAGTAQLLRLINSAAFWTAEDKSDLQAVALANPLAVRSKCVARSELQSWAEGLPAYCTESHWQAHDAGIGEAARLPS